MTGEVAGKLCRAGNSGCRLLLLAAAALCWSSLVALGVAAQPAKAAQRVYRNPVLFADYSDPDAIRVGDDFYLVASSFHFSPGLPILHSRDLVHWELLGHALPRLNFGPAYDMKGEMRYGRGVWAPALRLHNGLFYLYFPTPDEGIFVTTAAKMTGPWSEPVAVIAGPGWEDPCPFWDDDGKAYLVHSKLHAGPLILHRMAADGKSVLDAGKVIVNDPKRLPTLEGPKFYKRNGWYYIFAPMGGVGGGAQAVLRSRTIDGPYEQKIVLAQGDTTINGPHQGAYVETADGKGWFLHFQLRGSHGRIVHLEPVRWENDWPVMGEVLPGKEIGQPVLSAEMPVIAPGADRMKVRTSDEFSERTLDPMWEWNHNPENANWSLTARPGFLRLNAGFAADLLHARNTLTETMQDEALEFTTRVDLTGMQDGDRAGLCLLGKKLSSVGVMQSGKQRTLFFSSAEKVVQGVPVTQGSIQLRVRLLIDRAAFFYSLDEGRTFLELGPETEETFAWWKGVRPSLFAYGTKQDAAPPGHIDFDWARYEALTLTGKPKEQAAHARTR